MTDAPDKIALVTGAGSGIGRAAATALAGIGFDVVLAGRRRDPLEATAEQIATHGVTALSVVADITDPASIEALFAATLERYGRLDLLFNNAGVFEPAMPFDELPYDLWKAAVDTNLTGTFLCTQAAFRIMRTQTPRGGRIINNGSISAHTPRPLSPAYTATKHGVTGLTKSTALDGRPFDIACGQIDIGNAATEMTSRIAASGQQSPDKEGEMRMDVAHVGDAIAYMADLPLSANVLFMTVMSTKMPFVGRG